MTQHKVCVSVAVGYDLRSVELTLDEWAAVQSGEKLVREVIDYYEGEEFTYVFAFNERKEGSLVVTYDDADGFLGHIEDAMILELSADA